MKSRVTEDFVVLFGRLPDHVKAAARKPYKIWRENPAHPGLHFKKVHRTEPTYSVRIGLGWRAVGLLERDMMTWFWIGSHADYDRMLST